VHISHPFVPVRRAYVVILALHALAVLGAIDGRLEALAVLLQAVGLLAVASLIVHGGHHRHGSPVSLLHCDELVQTSRILQSPNIEHPLRPIEVHNPELHSSLVGG
jgi:hypothetical protein